WQEVFVEQFVIDGARENFFVIEKMHLLLVAHGDVRMFLKKVMQRCCPRFLRPRKDEIESLYFSPLLKHLLQVIITKGRLARPRRLHRPINRPEVVAHSSALYAGRCLSLPRFREN